MGLWASRQDKEPRLDRRRSLAGVPVLPDNVSIDRSNDDAWVLAIRVDRKNSFFSRFLPPTITKRVKLDELGTFVIKQIDGEKTVADIAQAFRREYGVTRREAELSIADFMKSLIARNAVAIAIRQ
ncbi:MAG: PqqD family protein [Candidatus Pacebacteria bacterium]|nr:PqqD family protein [Candidatus Paceibacterota bacterium]